MRIAQILTFPSKLYYIYIYKCGKGYRGRGFRVGATDLFLFGSRVEGLGMYGSRAVRFGVPFPGGEFLGVHGGKVMTE